MNFESKHKPTSSPIHELVPVKRSFQILSMLQVQRRHHERLLKQLLNTVENTITKDDLYLKHLKNNISMIAVYKTIDSIREIIAKLQMLLQSEIKIVEGNLSTIFFVDQKKLKRVLASI